MDPAWVVTAPPNYAPDPVASQPLYDVILDALGWSVAADKTPSFTRHILTVFQQFVDSQWVNAGFAARFGWHGLIDFTRPDLVERLAAPPVRKPGVQADPYGALRRQIFSAFRDPDSREFQPLQWPPLYGDAFFFQDDPPSPRVAFSITETSYGYLKQWMQGDFIGDYNPAAALPQSIDDVPKLLQPETLDHAALHFCVGGPFHPGCELTWPMRHGSLYRSKFRLRQRPPEIPEPDYGDFMTPELATSEGGPLSVSGPGDLTKWLAVPWQTDTASCRAGYSGTIGADTNTKEEWKRCGESQGRRARDGAQIRRRKPNNAEGIRKGAAAGCRWDRPEGFPRRREDRGRHTDHLYFRAGGRTRNDFHDPGTSLSIPFRTPAKRQRAIVCGWACRW